jgi:hypothetical protein
VVCFDGKHLGAERIMLMTASTLSDTETTDFPTEIPNVLPSLVGAFRDHGYEAGYARGVGDTHIALLEAVDEFSRQQSGSPARTRQLLYAFSEFLERKLDRKPARSETGFIDGAGI